MRAIALIAVSALFLTAAGCAKKDDNAEMTAPPADSAPMTPSEPSTAPMPSDTPPDATTPPSDTMPPDATQPQDTGTTPPPPAQ